LIKSLNRYETTVIVAEQNGNPPLRNVLIERTSQTRKTRHFP